MHRTAKAAALAAFLGCYAPALAALLDAATLEKYVDPLPIPSVLSPVGQLDGAPLYEVAVSQFQQKLHRDLPPTTLWGYEGVFPGPTIEVQSGQPVAIEWVNNLRDEQGDPLDHLLPYDTTIHGAGPRFPQARTITHVHGAVTDEFSDGFPEHWFGPDPQAPANGLGGPAGNALLATYPNNQRAAGNWYHDHSMGITRLNVYAGMAGLYTIRDANEAALNLPSGPYEAPLLLQDRSFNQDGSLFYPAGPGDTGQPGDDPLAGLPGDFPSAASQVSSFLADANLVNGAVWPFMEVEPRKYRFRVLNGANSRFYDLGLEPEAGASQAVAPDWWQIGTDGGLLAAPVTRDRIELAPADRADVVVDFSTFSPGDSLLLRNYAQGASSGTTDRVMQFRVVEPTGADQSDLPAVLSTVDRYDEADAVRVRTLTLDRTFDEYGRTELLLNDSKWTDPNTETIVQGEMEIWEFVNNTNMPHPMHVHMEAFQVLSRTNRFGSDIPLEDFDKGFEDTVTVGPRETVRIMVKFDQYTGEFVWHCHILEHEDLEMMRTFRIVPLGDYDQDGLVAMADYELWRTSYGATGDTLADGNNDGVVDAADYTIWRDAFAASQSPATVPEAATAASAALALLTLATGRPRG
ncbi:multicopper oxidase domain-containing protein [Botrimarina sp.]|uniref:multicopper oxidase domain-containing protein n=1 Tax=Botrimarina sp. TaxID=2795802 RepID=UPI0032EE3AD8